jgi:hypothetical protein
MDVLTSMYEHHIRLSGETIDQLDRSTMRRWTGVSSC